MNFNSHQRFFPWSWQPYLCHPFIQLILSTCSVLGRVLSDGNIPVKTGRFLPSCNLQGNRDWWMSNYLSTFKGDQPWDFFGRNDAKAETPVLWPPHAKNWLIGKDSDAGRDWGQEEKKTTEDEMAGWHHWLDGREFKWTPGVGDGQGGLACCDSWGRRVRHDWATDLIWDWMLWCGEHRCFERALLRGA